MKSINQIEKFELQKIKNIQKQKKDKDLFQLSLKWMQKTSKYYYTYNFSWLGRPIIQFPQDMFAMQEIIWEVKPDLIIETGIAHGGSLIFYASMLQLIGRGKVLGIDIDIRPHNRKAIESHPISKRIKMIEGSSISEDVVKKVRKIARKKSRVLVVLDSNHTHEHVLRELEIYSSFVVKDSYIVVLDTVIEDMPDDFFSNRPWCKGNNPKTAVRKFLKKNKNFKVDKNIENKLLITVAIGGYLKRIK